MKIKLLFTALSLILSGCARPELEFKKEPLTGKTYCAIYPKLSALKNSESGSLILKYENEACADKTPIKATLYITQRGRKYNIHPHETLKLYIDDIPYSLNVINLFQEPLEVVDTYSAYMPSGRAISFGTVKEITEKHLSFFLSVDCLTKMVLAKRIVFEISSHSAESSGTPQEYPIILEFSPESTSLLQEFKSKCINNPLNQSGINK